MQLFCVQRQYCDSLCLWGSALWLKRLLGWSSFTTTTVVQLLPHRPQLSVALSGPGERTELGETVSTCPGTPGYRRNVRSPHLEHCHHRIFVLPKDPHHIFARVTVIPLDPRNL